VGSGLQIEIISVESTDSLPPVIDMLDWDLPAGVVQPSDMVGPGDILNISIFEAGVSLFGGNMPAGAVGTGGFDPSVRVNTLPPSRVSDNGEIDIPYVGRLSVSGKTVGEIQDQIGAGLQDLSQSPQVLVSRQQVISNTVIIGGEIAQPGRLVLQTNDESITDVIALAGGYRGNLKDLMLRVQRAGAEANVRLSDILAGTYGDPRAFPGDRLTILLKPKMYSVLGASGRVQQMTFLRESMSVVEAISAAGGPASSSGDPESIFVFRFTGENKDEPVVYHFNMMRSETVFLAQRFALWDDDVVYFGNAAANQPRELIQTIGQLFGPIVTATAVANNLNN